MRRIFTKKRSLVALAAVAALAIAGGAFAYFTTNGSGSSNATVTSAAQNAGKWTVAVTPDTTDALLPGSGTASLPYTITNASSGHEGLTGVIVSIPTTTDGNGATVIENSDGSAATGCLASWFNLDGTAGSLSDSSPTLSASLPDDLASAGAVTGTATVTMSNVNSNQNACESVTPKVTVTAS